MEIIEKKRRCFSFDYDERVQECVEDSDGFGKSLNGYVTIYNFEMAINHRIS